MSHNREQDKQRDRHGPGHVPPSADAEAEAPWLDVLAEQATQPMDDGEAFVEATLHRWEQEAWSGRTDSEAELVNPPSLGIGSRSEAAFAVERRPTRLRRWSAIAAGMLLAAGIGWFAGQHAAQGPGEPTASQQQRGTVATSTTSAQDDDPVGVLMDDVHRQMQQRPQQVRQAIESVAALLTGDAGDAVEGWLDDTGEGDQALNGSDRRS